MATTQKIFKPTGFSVFDDENQYFETYATFDLNMLALNCGVQVMTHVDGWEYWKARKDASRPNSRRHSARGTREAWDFYRGFGDNADIPVLVLAAELGNSQSGRVANAIIGVALGMEQEQITLGIRPYDHPGSRTVNYNDVNDQMRKDLTEALADMVGEVVICRRNTRSGLLTYHGLISPNADGRRGVPRPNSLVMLTIDEVYDLSGKELFNNVHYPAVEGDNAMPAAPQLPTVQFDIFKDIGPEAVERLMAAGKTDDGEGAPVGETMGAYGISSSDELADILEGVGV